MNDKLLIQFNYCWADEFDVDSLWITTKLEYEEFINKLQHVNLRNKEVYFGTNEYVMFDSTEDFIDSLIVTSITDDFYYEALKVIGTEFGLISIANIADYYGGDEEDEYS